MQEGAPEAFSWVAVYDVKAIAGRKRTIVFACEGAHGTRDSYWAIQLLGQGLICRGKVGPILSGTDIWTTAREPFSIRFDANCKTQVWLHLSHSLRYDQISWNFSWMLPNSRAAGAGGGQPRGRRTQGLGIDKRQVAIADANERPPVRAGRLSRQ